MKVSFKEWGDSAMITEYGGESGVFDFSFDDLIRLTQLLGIVQPHLSGYRLEDVSFAEACEILHQAEEMTDYDVATSRGQIEDVLYEPVDLDDLEVRAIDVLMRRRIMEAASEIDNPYARKSSSGRTWLEIDFDGVDDVINGVLK